MIGLVIVYPLKGMMWCSSHFEPSTSVFELCIPQSFPMPSGVALRCTIGSSP